jgi:hypothetical protein
MGIGPGPDGFASTTRPVFVQHGTVTGRIPPRSGGSLRAIEIERNRDYPADSDLVLGRGNVDTRIRLTGADLHLLRSRLMAQDDLAAVKDRAASYIRDVLDEVNPDIAEWAERNMYLAATAHADGYKLCAEDHRETAQDAGYVIDFLYEMIGDRDPDAGGDDVRLSDMAKRDIDAIERVVAMLRGAS